MREHTPANRLIDCHVHLVVPGGDPERGFVSDEMRKSSSFRLVQRLRGLAGASPEDLARAYLDELRRELHNSREVSSVVLLALDGVYDRGQLDRASTHMYVSNDAVFDLAASDHRILIGASVNPLRHDWESELRRVAERGAVLIKWLPNAQCFDPAAKQLDPFYRLLTELHLPLMIHSGIERAVAASGFSEGGDPERWVRALDAGVQVIAAHAGSSGRFGVGRAGKAFLRLVDQYPNLYADSSALALPNRVAMMRRLLREPALQRLTFGTDFPLPCWTLLLLLFGRFRGFLTTHAQKNYFDRQVAFFRGLGWNPQSTVLERLLAAKTT